MNALLAFLSHDYSGLVIALVLLAAAVLGYRSAKTKPVSALWGALGLAGLVLAGGAVSHLLRLSGIDERLPPPGVMVDVGGHAMHVLAEGPDEGPAVVWFAGGHVGGHAFHAAHEAIKTDIRSILVDRPGTGWSEAGPFPRTTAAEAEEVMRALDAAGEEGPFIWAGHSFGGLLAANIARRYPEKSAALVLLDPTPLDIIFYGLDRKGLASLKRSEFIHGLRRLFGLYRLPETEGAGPMGVIMLLRNHARAGFAGASIYEELTAEGLIDRAFETVVFDGELGDLPLYLVTPNREPETTAYAEMVAGPGPRAERFEEFLFASRERYLSASDKATRIYTPEGTTHNFPSEVPEWLVDTLREIVGETRARAAAADASYALLTTAWPGPYGGVPPVDQATPAAIEAAYRRAIDEKRAEVAAIAAQASPPTFENTVLALETSGVALDRIEKLLAIFTSTASNPEIGALALRVAPLKPQLEDEIAHDTALFRRLEAVYESLPGSAPDEEARRLVEVTRESLLRRGAGLAPEEKRRLTEINARLAELRTQFGANVRAEEASLAVFVDDEAELGGLTAREIAAAKSAAAEKDRPEAWAIRIARPAVWPVLTRAHSRSLREAVWRAWATRGANEGEHDNRPVMTEILKLRGEKAKLFGYDNFAGYQTAVRMIGTPEKAMEILLSSWDLLLPRTRADIRDLQALADADGGDFALEPWDRLYYAERYRRQNFGIDDTEITAYFQLGNIVEAMFWTANRLLGFEFRELDGMPTVSPDIRVFEVTRGDDIVGVLWMDLFQRAGKGPSSWAAEYRTARRGETLPLVALHSAATPAADGGPVLVEWERANVIFHEFGHALHMLSSQARYASLGSVAVPWDFIEAPSLLYERWFMDREVLRRFARHHETGEPMSEDLIERLEQARNYDRVFSATLSFLGTAIVDMRLHQQADGREIDAMAVERSVLEQLDMPQAVDLLLYVQHAFHTFTQQYAAGVYTYLWSDIIAADIAESFLAAPGGLYDADVARRYRETILEVGNTVPAAQAFRDFKGRDPDPAALFRRFGIETE